MSDLSIRFVGLGPNDRARFLTRVAHMATIAARDSCISSVDHPHQSCDQLDAALLRDANNFVHRVIGYILHVLNGEEMAGQDESMMRMIEQYYGERGLSYLLSEWLPTSE